jgi:hypothetical protein
MTDDAALALRARLPGVICATVTPFLPDSLEVDWAGVRANVDFLLARGVSALVVNGSIAEHSSMSHEEQIRAVRETVDAAAGAVPVIAGCSHTDPRVAVELCRSAAAAGADGAMLLAPYYFRLSPEEVEDFFRSIDGAIGMPFLLYDNPTTGQVELPAETIEAISRLRNFAALKEASQDVLRAVPGDRGGRGPSAIHARLGRPGLHDRDGGVRARAARRADGRGRGQRPAAGARDLPPPLRLQAAVPAADTGRAAGIRRLHEGGDRVGRRPRGANPPAASADRSR